MEWSTRTFGRLYTRALNYDGRTFAQQPLLKFPNKASHLVL
jgi:hypothetical protein